MKQIQESFKTKETVERCVGVTQRSEPALDDKTNFHFSEWFKDNKKKPGRAFHSCLMREIIWLLMFFKSLKDKDYLQIDVVGG